MSHLPTIISDLAMILLVAGITTIIFKKINQPLVLGYIVAGFITGPNFSFFPTIADAANVQSWSEIGVIFLMFALGLEFSFYKLKSVGSTAFIAQSIILVGMIAVGYLAGTLLGWTQSESLFLGGMLSISSTAIIIKAFDDLKLRTEKFTEVVFGILIIQDIIGIIMLVLVSTLAAASSSISSVELLMSIARLAFFIVLWFVSGMYLIPSFFKWAQNLMNEETLVVASIGLCLGMVVLATSLGFSSALGAFIMGSLIAEAPNAEKIEHLVSPIKNLFGAVFFVSVGMMVNPALLVEHWLPVLVIVLATILGQMTFSTLGVIASGQNLHTAVRSGFALTQIGEFSFIIASLGTSVGMLRDFIYPIIVAVSVITTFTTPFCINAAESAYAALVRLLPQKVLDHIARYTDSKEQEEAADSEWKELLTSYVMRMMIFTTLLFAISIGAQMYLLPYLDTVPHLPFANLITAGITLLAMSPILRAVLVNRTSNADLFGTLWFKRRANHLPLLVLVLGKMLVAAASLYFIFHNLAGLHGIIAVLAVAAAGYGIYSSDWLMGEYLRIESRFLVNLNEKHMRKHRAATDAADGDIQWFDEDLQLATYRVEKTSSAIGKTLIQLSFREYYGFNILQIASRNEIIDMPGGNAVLAANDELLIIGTEVQLKNFSSAITQRKMGFTCVQPPRTLRQFMLDDHTNDPEHKFLSLAITIDKNSPILGKSLKAADLRNRWNCLVIGLERGAFTMTNPNVSLVFEKDDLLWVLGKQKMMNTLIREEIL